MKIFKINDSFIKLILLISIIGIILTPIIDSFSLLFTSNTPYLKLLLEEKILWSYLLNTIELIFKVGLFSIVLGFSTSYIITMYEFKYKQFFKIVLTLPLAFPVYVGAYTYSSIFYNNKWLEVIFKNAFFMNGSIFIYGIFLYPYIYLSCRSYLQNNLVEYIEASKTLGKSPKEIFYKIILPLSWPAILGSTLFVIFETLSDFAVIEYYGINTISKIITDSWMGLGQKDTAAKVSLMLIFIITGFIFFEKRLRSKKRYNSNSNKKIKTKYPATGLLILIYIYLGAIVSLGFTLPFYEMIKFTISKILYLKSLDLFGITLNTLLTVLISISIILILGIILASIINQLKKGRRFYSTLGVIGYSIPSLILALSVYTFMLSLDGHIYDIFKIESLNLMETRVVLIVAITIKFISIAISNYLNTLSKINPNIFNASSNLGLNFIGTFFKVNIPLLKKSTKFIFILLFIDIIKELTLTYSLRPFNFKTLSTEIYRYAGNEMIEVAAIPSLVIVGVCSIMIIYLELGGGKKIVKNR